MQRTSWLLIAFVASCQPILGAQGEIIDRVLAVVAGEVITQSDVDGAIALDLVSNNPPGAGPATVPRPPDTAGQGSQDRRAAALERLIDRALMLAEVRRYVPPEPAVSAIEQRLEVIRQKFSPPSTYSQTLAIYGIDEARLRDFVRDDLRIAAYLDERFSSSEPERRQTMISDWLTGLRRRADVTRPSSTQP